MNIILCGLPMSGKSHLGKKLSELLHWQFVDTDNILEDLYMHEAGVSASCREIFKLKGEVYFRDLERKAIDTLKGIKRTVIAIGGGALNSPENVTTLQKLGKLIFLDCDLETLIERLKSRQQIPSYLDEHHPIEALQALAKARVPIYQQHCDVVLPTQGLNEMEIIAKICSNLL